MYNFTMDNDGDEREFSRSGVIEYNLDLNTDCCEACLLTTLKGIYVNKLKTSKITLTPIFDLNLNQGSC